MFPTIEELEFRADLVEGSWRTSDGLGIPRSLLLAIILVESSGEPDAMRYEPKWKYFYRVAEFAIKHGVTYETEKQLQKFSFGILQVMGSVAREHGFQGRLTDLLSPERSLGWGSIHLHKFYVKYGNWPDAISAYNQGSSRKVFGGQYKNQGYVDKVMTAWDYYAKEEEIRAGEA